MDASVRYATEICISAAHKQSSACMSTNKKLVSSITEREEAKAGKWTYR